jgi:hypothetical protein
MMMHGPANVRQSDTCADVSPIILVFPLSVSFHKSSILIFIYMLFLPGQHMAKSWDISKNIVLSEIKEH